MRKNDTGMMSEMSETEGLSVAGPDWSDQELEQFHDEELAGSEAAALSEALRVRPELRARLADIARADGLMLAAMTGEREAGLEARGAAALIGARPIVWAAAAVLVIAGGGLLALKMMRSASGSGTAVLVQDDGARGPEGSDPSAEPYRAVRVVFSLPLRNGETWGVAASEGSAVDEPRGNAVASTDQEAERAKGDFIERLDKALAVGRVDEALAMLKEARAEEREKAYARFGSAMRSSRSAMEVMDAIEPAEQVAACRQWIAAGTQRQFAMERLRMLGRRAELEESVRIAVRGLIAEDPSLRAWAMSYVPWAVEKSGAEQG